MIQPENMSNVSVCFCWVNCLSCLPQLLTRSCGHSIENRINLVFWPWRWKIGKICGCASTCSQGRSLVAFGSAVWSLLRVAAMPTALLGHKKPPQPGIFMGFSVSENHSCAPLTLLYSYVLRGFAILSFFSRNIQTVKGMSAGLGIPRSVREYMAESSLFWARSGITKTSRRITEVSVRSHCGNLRQVKPGWSPFVFLCMNPIPLGKANTYVTSILQGELFREIFWASPFIYWFISLGTGSK